MALSGWWQKQAYRHKGAEVLLYTMFISGLLLWSRLPVPWGLERWGLLVHMLLGISVFLVVITVFWSSHRRLVVRSKNSFLRTSGRLIEVLLLLCCLSGFYLFFLGNSGALLNQLISDLHFYSSILLAPLVFRHAMRWSVINLKRIVSNRLSAMQARASASTEVKTETTKPVPANNNQLVVSVAASGGQ